MKPHIIIHMMSTIDGRIDCPVVGQLSTDEYYVALEKLGPCSKLSGRVTAALECSAVREEADAPFPGRPVGQESVHIARKAEEYTLVADTRGRLRWNSGEADGHPVLCLVSGQVSEAYLEHLRQLGISWIATGQERLDLPRAMELLYGQFGIKRVAVVGGGHICGGFLEAGLIDEVSLMVAPGIDGRQGQTAVFDGLRTSECRPWHLELQSAEPWPTGIVWLRYKMK